MYQGRACYLDKFPGQEKFSIQAPVFPDDGVSKTPVNQIPGPVLPIGTEPRIMSKSDLLDELELIGGRIPEMPIFEILQNFFRQPIEACPTSLLEPYIMFLIDAEQASREYQTLPFSGGLWDQPSLLLDSFTQIRYERNQYERIRMQKLARDAKRNDKSSAGPGRKTIPGSESEKLGLPPRNN